MASSLLSEDLIRTLSRLVFACTASDQMTLRLFDPVTEKLSSYLLVKVLDDEADSRRRSPNLKSPPPQVILDDLTERLKSVVREETLADAQKTRPSRASRLPQLRFRSNLQSDGCPSGTRETKSRSSLREADAPAPSVAPERTTRKLHRRNAGIISYVAGDPFLVNQTVPMPPSHAKTSADEPLHNRGALNWTAKGKRSSSAPRLVSGTRVSADGEEGRVFTSVSEVGAADTGHVDAPLPAHGIEDGLQAELRAYTKTTGPRLGAHHETLPSDAVDFPPFLVTSTPRAVARHRMSLALGHTKVLDRLSEKDGTRRTSLPVHFVKPSFDLGAFDPEIVVAAVAESNRRASVGVAPPRASRNWERVRSAGQ